MRNRPTLLCVSNTAPWVSNMVLRWNLRLVHPKMRSFISNSTSCCSKPIRVLFIFVTQRYFNVPLEISFHTFKVYSKKNFNTLYKSSNKSNQAGKSALNEHILSFCLSFLLCVDQCLYMNKLSFQKAWIKPLSPWMNFLTFCWTFWKIWCNF